METPKPAALFPKVIELEAGSYWWCACGLSGDQPMCDGSHKGTAFGSKKFTLEEKKTVALCLCKRTANPPYCDGSHSRGAPQE